MKKIIDIFKKFKPAFKIAIVGIVLFLVYNLFAAINFLPKFGNIFKNQKPTIDQTPILITEIKKIAQLFTVTAYDEVVQDTGYFTEPNTTTVLQKLSLRLPLLLPNTLVLIVKGKIMAGTSLTNLTDTNIFKTKDSISITIPQATILDAIINPSDIEVFDEAGTWPQNLVAQQITSAKQKMINSALENKILEKANEQAILIIKNFLLAAGFKKVTVVVI